MYTKLCIITLRFYLVANKNIVISWFCLGFNNNFLNVNIQQYTMNSINILDFYYLCRYDSK